MHDTHTLSPLVTWACVEDDFHVASRDGNFLGFTDRSSNGEFIACDQHSRPIGRFADRSSAMNAVLSTSPFESVR